MAKFRLTVPIDATGIENAEGGVKVAVVDARGRRQSQVVKVTRGRAQGEFTFAEPPPAPLRVLVGPETASDDELEKLETITASVNARSLRNLSSFTLAPIKLPPYIWHLWPAWCRKFKVSGVVRCPGTNQPVPGATVCIEEVDYFFIWTATQSLGCVTTDQNGFFEYEFTWCCGWRPWYWDSLYRWKLNLGYASSVYAQLPPELRTGQLPQPGPEPDLDLVEKLLKLTPPLQKSFAIANAPEDDAADLRAGALLPAPTTSKSMKVDAGRAEAIRRGISVNLPFPNILPIWPWKPWYPWNDCNPDLIFRVTQECEGKINVIVDEKIEDTHWNVPQNFHVTLNANDLACCVPDEPNCTTGNCLVLTHACGVDRVNIGGNVGAPAGLPAGYATGDRAFAGVIPITGTATCMDEVDYYRFLYTGPGAPSPTPVPHDSMGGFTRTYFTISPFELKSAAFNATLIDGRYVFKSPKQYEDESPDFTTPPGAVWYQNRDLLMRWLTDSEGWADGLYTLQVEGFTYNAATQKLTPKELFSCETQLTPNQPSTLKLRVDNRIIGPAAHPLPHLCGPGSVHTCTMEPEVHISNVSIIRGAATLPIAPCSLEELKAGDAIEITYIAWDPDGHLGGYSLFATFGLNESSNLLALAAPSPASMSVDGIPVAGQVGPVYNPAWPGRPIWRGGAMKLRIEGDDLCAAFPKDCCYQLELRASKRVTESCQQQHENLSEYSFFLATSKLCNP